MNVTLSLMDTESISTNYNDKELLKGETVLAEICREITVGKYKKSTDFSKVDSNKKLLGMLEQTLSTRFGFNINFELIDEINVHTTGLRTVEVTTFKQNKVDVYKQIERFGATQDKKILKDLQRMEKAVNDSLFKGRLVLDDKEVKVYGLNDKAKAVIYLGLVELVAVGLNVKQIMGLILHEIGHCYYGLRYIHQTREFNTELTNNLSMVTKDPKQLNKRIGHVTINGEKLQDEGTILNVINLTNKTITAIESNKKSTVKENERLADQFATRFGYAADMVSGLRVIESKMGKRKENHLEFISYGIVLITISPLLPLFSFIGIIFIRYGTLAFIDTPIILGIIQLFLPYSFTVLPETYDDIRIRLERLKQDINKQLAENKEDKEMVKAAINTIERLEKQLVSTPYDKTVASALGQYIRNHDQAAGEIIKNRLDAIAGNDIHKQAAKFSIL